MESLLDTLANALEYKGKYRAYPTKEFVTIKGRVAQRYIVKIEEKMHEFYVYLPIVADDAEVYETPIAKPEGVNNA